MSEDLYHPDLLAYAKDHPRMRRHHDADHVVRASNPICGDKFEIRFDVDDVITDASFFGYGCVVSKASTALLVDALIGKTPAEALSMINDYLAALKTESRKEPDEKLKPLLIARKYPGRVQCASLSWEAMVRELS